jgi:hypothetical protein
MDTQQPKNSIESLFESTSQYVDTRLELAKLKAVKKSSETVAIVGTKIIVAAVFFLFFFMLNIGLALWLGEVSGKIYYGFLIVSFLYFVIGLIIYFNSDKWIKTSIANAIIKQLNK